LFLLNVIVLLGFYGKPDAAGRWLSSLSERGAGAEPCSVRRAYAEPRILTPPDGTPLQILERGL